MSAAIRGRTAIVGIGSTGVGETPGYSAIELLGQASLKAITNAGLKLPDIDAIFVATDSHVFPTLSVAEYFGVRPKFVDGTNTGGSSLELYLLQTTLVPGADLCDVMLICYGSSQRTAGSRLVSMSESQWHEALYKSHHPTTAYALAASRHMHQYGTTREQLAEVAVSVRQWANLNPEALARGPLSTDSVLTTRMVSDPLSTTDCCLVTDGDDARVVMRVEHARDLPNAPVYFLGAAGAQWHYSIMSMSDLTVTMASEGVPRTMQMAGVRHTDISLAMLYDAFTINTLLFLEDPGSCAKDEGGPFIQGGRIASGGELAANTNGGGLSCVHPGMHGMLPIIGTVTQPHRQTGERQLARVNVASLYDNDGTLSSQITVLLGTDDTLQTPGRRAFQALPWRCPAGALARGKVVMPVAGKRIR